ncbi:hypothetical protein CKO23_06050 [Thiocystis violacea]|nr:hypothetical protein [Thiocystis violacea]
MPSQPSRQDRTAASWAVALACAVLLLAQTALALHEIDHFSHPHEGVCELCAIAVGSAPLPALPPSVAAPPRVVALQSVRPEGLLRDDRAHRPHSARAPPKPLLIA